MSIRTEKYFEHSCRSGSSAGVCRSRGGESCAFDGAMIVLQCIADAAHLVHGPIACCGNSWESRGTLSDKGSLHKRAYTTDLNELDIVYGSEEKLLKAIRETRHDSRAGAIFVYNTCVTGLTGENIEGVCKRSEEELAIRVIPVNAPGFVGPKNLGNRIAGDVLLEYVIGTGEPPAGMPGEINLIGEYNIAGDLFLVEPLLNEAGIRIRSRITGNASFEEIRFAHRAKLNVLVCSRALVNVAREMERRYGIPYLEVSFFGDTEMSRALRGIAGHLEESTGHPFQERIEKLIGRRQEILKERLAPYKELRGKRAILYSGGVKSWSIISALMDIGIEVVAVGTKKATLEDEEKMKEILGEDAPLYESMTPKKILSLIKEKGADMLIAGGRNLYLAIKEGIPFVDVNQERHTPYAGYDGLVNLARRIHEAFVFYHGSSAFNPSRVRTEERPVTINPLKHSPAVGAVMALQGVHGALPLMHGAQGCSFLGKVLLTKHFREPIAMVSSKLFVENVVMGSEEQLDKVIRESIEKQSPELIAVLTSGLSEVKGDHISPVIGKYRSRKIEIIHVSTPDYKGGLEQGYSEALCGLAELAVQGRSVSGRINVLAGHHLTPADAAVLREWFEFFGLSPILLPDLSALDGSREEFSSVALGGASLSSIRSMGGSEITVAIGLSTVRAAEALERTCRIPFTVFESLSGLQSSDRLFSFLEAFSGRPIPDRIMRERRILVDGMRDAQFAFGGKRIVAAQEADLALATTEWLREMGTKAVLAVVPTHGPSVERIRAEEVVVGDFGSINKGYDLLISNSHGREAARRLGMIHYPMGFPIVEELGANTRVTIGYRGTLNLVNDAGNRLMGGV